MPLARNTRFGPYEIVTFIGAGGMGEVYRARDTRLDREVAVKVLAERLACDPRSLSRSEVHCRAVTPQHSVHLRCRIGTPTPIPRDGATRRRNPRSANRAVRTSLAPRGHDRARAR